MLTDVLLLSLPLRVFVTGVGEGDRDLCTPDAAAGDAEVKQLRLVRDELGCYGLIAIWGWG